MSFSDTEESLPLGVPVDSSPAERPQRVTLEGRFVSIAPLDPEVHAESLYGSSHGSDQQQLWRYMSDGPFPDRGDFDSQLRMKASSEDPLFFAILEKPSGIAVGYASYLRIKPVHRCIEVGNILYTPALQQTTGATEAMYLMARYVFEDLGYRRYEWKCNALNAPSRRAALRFGFKFEGIFEQHMIIKGRNRDTAWFSMLDLDWPARRSNFERWLSPSNFDAAGRQKLALSSLSAPRGE